MACWQVTQLNSARALLAPSCARVPYSKHDYGGQGLRTVHLRRLASSIALLWDNACQYCSCTWLPDMQACDETQATEASYTAPFALYMRAGTSLSQAAHPEYLVQVDDLLAQLVRVRVKMRPSSQVLGVRRVGLRRQLLFEVRDQAVLGRQQGVILRKTDGSRLSIAAACLMSLPSATRVDYTSVASSTPSKSVLSQRKASSHHKHLGTV